LGTNHTARTRSCRHLGLPAKITTEAIKLDSYIDEIIGQLKLQSPAYPSKKETPKGEYIEVTMDIRLPKPVTVYELSDLLEKIETKDPKVIVRDLNIRKNFAEKNKLDVSLVVATYYKKATKKREDSDEKPDKADKEEGKGS
jgi:hypothetical protein